MHVLQLLDIIEILRNIHCRYQHILGLVWLLLLLNMNSKHHHVQCLSQSAIYRSEVSSQSSSSLLSLSLSSSILVTSNTMPLSRDGTITTTLSYDVRFADDFWSGAVNSDDESMTYSKKSNARLAAGRETFVKTATVVATVYVDGNSDEYDDSDDCNSINCHGDGNIDVNSLVFDKHFWLITRIGGALIEDELPNFRQRLAELYRKAFNRQQLIHLGFTMPMSTTTTELPVITMASGELQTNGSQQNVSIEIKPTSVLKYESMANNRTNIHRNHSTIIVLPSINLTTIFDTENIIQSSQSRSAAHKKVSPTIRLTPVAPTQTQTSSKLNDLEHMAIKRNAHDSLNHLKHEHRKRTEVTIDIIIHNISVALDDFNDAENRNEWLVKNGIRNASMTKTTTTMPSTNPLNQTEIIYTVLVNGNAVLAIIAAGDMELMTDAEATNELDRVVYIKAEPYLKEPPYATPLIPSATSTEFSTVFAQFLHTPNSLILIGIVIFLLTCLLMALMLLSIGSRRPKQSSKLKNFVSCEVQTSHNVSPVLPSHFERNVRSIDEYAVPSTIAPPPSTGPRVNTINPVANQMTSLHGFDNFGYERDHSFILIPSPPKANKQNMHNKKVGTPNIYFPSPPSAASTTATQSSVDSLSDTSSIYYIKKPKRERDRDRLTDSSRSRGRVYATILRKPSNRKATNHAKQKRKYLKSENRVGTLVETAQVHSSHSDNTRIDGISGDDIFDERKDANFYEHIEAINPFAGNYANQKRRQFVETAKSEERVDASRRHSDTVSNAKKNVSSERNRRENNYRSKTAEAKLKSTANMQNVNFLEKKSSKQRQNPLKTGANDDDSISVGSFLSMASVRSFPKCSVPEPLTRVLNYEDDIDNVEAINRVPRIVDTKMKNDGWTTMPVKSVDDAKFDYFTRTRSDGADPGVIGPIVWQLHKKQQKMTGAGDADSLSPLRDPVFERNRYEGLLDGAMNLYTIETTEMHSVETATDTATMSEKTQRKSIYASKVVNEH